MLLIRHRELIEREETENLSSIPPPRPPQNIPATTIASTPNQIQTNTPASNQEKSTPAHGATTTTSTTTPLSDVPAKSLASPQPPSRTLLGIFSTADQKDFTRRKLVRKTYLSMLQTMDDLSLSEAHPDALCSLADLVDEDVPTGDCRLVYTFVLAAYDSSNTTAASDLTEPSSEDPHPAYTVDRSDRGDDGFERDAVYLNIRENMNDGKTMTWFRYASSVLPEDLGIDLIAKVDGDTMLNPFSFLPHLDRELHKQGKVLQRPAEFVYGGFEEVGRSGEELYMQGGFYFLSRDVARRVSSDACPRAEIVRKFETDRDLERAEDREVGLFVEHCWRTKDPQDTIAATATKKAAGTRGAARKQLAKRRLRKVFVGHGWHGSALKDSNTFRVHWKKTLAREVAGLRFDALRKEHPATQGCPPTREAAASALSWFDERSKTKLARSAFLDLVDTLPCSSFGFAR